MATKSQMQEAQNQSDNCEIGDTYVDKWAVVDTMIKEKTESPAISSTP